MIKSQEMPSFKTVLTLALLLMLSIPARAFEVPLLEEFASIRNYEFMGDDLIVSSSDDIYKVNSTGEITETLVEEDITGFIREMKVQGDKVFYSIQDTSNVNKSIAKLKQIDNEGIVTTRKTHKGCIGSLQTTSQTLSYKKLKSCFSSKARYKKIPKRPKLPSFVKKDLAVGSSQSFNQYDNLIFSKSRVFYNFLLRDSNQFVLSSEVGVVDYATGIVTNLTTINEKIIQMHRGAGKLFFVSFVDRDERLGTPNVNLFSLDINTGELVNIYQEPLNGTPFILGNDANNVFLQTNVNGSSTFADTVVLSINFNTQAVQTRKTFASNDTRSVSSLKLNDANNLIAFSESDVEILGSDSFGPIISISGVKRVKVESF